MEMCQQVDWKNLELIKPRIGFGGFSDVYRSKWTKNDGTCVEVVVKLFRETNNEKYNEREIENLTKLSHENIVTLYGITESPESRTLAILLEYADCGTLYNCLYDKLPDGGLYSYDYSDCLRWMQQFATALAYLHERNIIHRDLKPQNLLMFDNYQKLKIGDFGAVKEMMSITTEMIGTAAYMAPEASIARCTLKSDVYSYGIIFNEVLARKKPFSHLENPTAIAIQNLSYQGVRPVIEEIKKNVPQEQYIPVRQLIESCWKKEPHERPTIQIIETCFPVPSADACCLDISYLLALRRWNYVSANPIELEKPLIYSKKRDPPTPSYAARKLHDKGMPQRYSQFAPYESEWYHGLLDGERALERLQKSRKPGSYFVHRDKNQSVFMLRYRDEENQPSVFSICVEYGDYYINKNYRFSSLNELVGYYMAFDIYDGCRLKTPVPPPEPVVDKNRVIAIYSYTKEFETNELSFQKGDIFTVHNVLDFNWLWVTNHRSGERGIIYNGFVNKLSAFTDVNKMYSWFHPNCNKEQASNLLMRADPGSFLVRPSEEYPKDYLLCVRLHSSIIEEFRIENKNVYYKIYAHQFDSLNELIDHYRENEEIVEGIPLSQPVSHPKDSFIWESEDTGDTGKKKIYEELLISRDRLEANVWKGTIQESYLDLRTTKTNSWKNLYMKLREVPSGWNLYIYETRRQIKHISLIELAFAELYECHNSLWGIGSHGDEYFFKIVDSLDFQGKFTDLSAATSETYRAWISSLQRICTYPLRESLKRFPYVRGRHSLKIFVGEAVGLPGDFTCCDILLDQVCIARTSLQAGPNIVWNKEFELDDIPPNVTSVTFELRHGNRLTWPLNSLDQEKEMLHKYQLMDYGSLQLSIRYMNDLRMTKVDYDSLQNWLLELEVPAMEQLISFCYSDKQRFAASLFRVFQYNGRDIDLIVKLCTASEPNIKTDSLLITFFLRNECAEYLKATLSKTVQFIAASKQSAELDPNRLEINEDASAYLRYLLDQLSQSIYNSLAICPPSVRYICSCLIDKQATLPDANRRKTVVAKFMFLRLFCPALLYAFEFGLLDEEPPFREKIVLYVVAKSLCQLASLTEFDCEKEAYMTSLNPYIMENRARMAQFLDEVPQANAISVLPHDGERDEAIADDLDILYSICYLYLPRLKIECNEEWSHKLIEVINNLRNHKEKLKLQKPKWSDIENTE